jgi:hypothetical protein
MNDPAIQPQKNATSAMTDAPVLLIFAFSAFFRG